MKSINRSKSSGFFISIAFGLHIVIVLYSLVTCSDLIAEDNSALHSYLGSYPQTTINTLQRPLSWDNNDWTKAAGFVFIGGCLYFFDEEISKTALNNRTQETKDIAYISNQFGEGKYILSALFVTYLSGFAFDSSKTQDTALLSLKSFLLANGASLSIKTITQRERPFQKRGKTFWNGKDFSFNKDSFPSGHATIVWSIAPILAEQYKESVWVAPTAYSIALLTSYARIHNQRHWASDVYAGAAIGYITSQLVLKSTPRLEVIPTLEPKGVIIGWGF
jgi:hypothetical protein